MILSMLSGGLLINLIILFVIVFLSALGVPGGMITLVSMGALSNNYSELILVIIVGAIAAIFGDLTAYLIARKFSAKVSSWLKKFKFYRNNESRAREQLNKSEFMMVFLTRFLFTTLCTAVSYISGLERLSKKKFIVAVVFGEILYALIFPVLGFFFKETWSDITNTIASTIIVLTLIILSGLITYFVVKKLRAKNKLK